MKTVSTLDEFCKHNHQDVVKIVYKLCKNKFNDPLFSVEDTIQNVYLAFAHQKTIEKFDRKRSSAKFSTYVMQCIKYKVFESVFSKRGKEMIFYKANSLSTPLKHDSNTLVGDFLEDSKDETHDNEVRYDFKQACERFFANTKKNRQGRKLSMDVLLQEYLMGSKDAEISRKFSITAAGVGAKKRRLREMLSFYMEEHL